MCTAKIYHPILGFVPFELMCTAKIYHPIGCWFLSVVNRRMCTQRHFILYMLFVSLCCYVGFEGLCTRLR